MEPRAAAERLTEETRQHALESQRRTLEMEERAMSMRAACRAMALRLATRRRKAAELQTKLRRGVR